MIATRSIHRSRATTSARDSLGERSQLGLDLAPVGQVARERRLVAESAPHPRLVGDARAAYPAAQHDEPRTHRRAEAPSHPLDVGGCQLANRADLQFGELARRLGSDAPQCLRPPIAHDFQPVLRRQSVAPCRLGERTRRLGPQLVVADADRTVQSGLGEHGRAATRWPVPQGRECRCQRLPRPSPTLRRRRGSVAIPP